MAISVSTIMYPPYQLESVWPLLGDAKDDKIGIEVFPFFHLTWFEQLLEKNVERLKKRPVTVHCPYFCTDSCCEKGTPEYDLYMYYFIKTLKYAKELNASYLVHHFYNFHFAPQEREEKRRIALKNLEEFKRVADEYGIMLALENTETTRNPEENMFTQQEFIQTVKKHPDSKVLIDIGHVCCAGWNLTEIIAELREQIIGYHVHNNDGFADSHKRIMDGILDMKEFVNAVQKYTPDAELTLEYEMNYGKNNADVCQDIEYFKNAGLG